MTAMPRKQGRRKKEPVLVTRRELAALLEKHPMSVIKWQEAGMPVASRGSRGRPSYYNEVDVRAWLQLREEAARKEGPLDAVQQRAMKDRAQTALAEQALRIRSRDLLPREEVEKLWAAEFAAVRTLLLGWPTTLADKIARAYVAESIAGVERVLNDEVRNVLRELADPGRGVEGAA